MKRRILLFAFLWTFVVCLTEASGQSIPSYKSLKYPPLPQVHVAEPATFTLSNGMRVFLLEDHELPLIQGLALVRTGNLFDPADKRGLSSIMAEVLRSGGTKSKTGDQIDEELENIAGSVEAGMDETSASISFSGLKETTDSVLGVFKDVMTDPEFRQDKIDLMLDQTRSGIARRNDEASDILAREMQAILYGRDNSYGWIIEYEHLANIHREDLQQFYRRYYFPKNIMLAVYGDFSTAEMKDKLEKLFASWTVEQPPVPPFPAVTAKPAPGVYFAEKPDVTQTFFALGKLGGMLRDRDYPALEVASNILGSGFTSRLMSEIRTKLGYAYSIGASWGANYDHAGTFQISGSTKSQSTTETLQAINEQLNRIRTTEVSQQELDTAKQSALNSFVFFFDSPAKTLNRVLRYEYYNYPKDFLFQYQKGIEAVTRADVLRVAQEHFRPEDLAIVAVGNSKDFGKPLSALGKVNVIDLTIPDPKTAAAVPGSSEPAPARALLARAQQAMGGADKLAAVRDSSESIEMALETGPAGLRVIQRNRFVAPAFYRQDQELPFGKISIYTDGKSGWMATGKGTTPLAGPVLQQARGEVFRRLIHLVLADRDPSLSLSSPGENQVEIADPGGLHVILELDTISGLPLLEKYATPGAGGASREVVEHLSDWKEAGGVLVPFKITLEQAGKKLAVATVTVYTVNSGLRPEELNQKP